MDSGSDPVFICVPEADLKRYTNIAFKGFSFTSLLILCNIVLWMVSVLVFLSFKMGCICHVLSVAGS